jgi:DNA-binding MarR family transcriptional regulator
MTAANATVRVHPRDSIGRFVKEWRRERPDLDPWPLEILGRIQLLSDHLLRLAEARLATIGLTWETFSLLVTLRRSGPPFALRPTDFYRESLLTSGTITNRIDRVEALGLVTRTPDRNDRRAVIVRLTRAGQAVADRAIELHFKTMAAALSSLPAPDRRDLAQLLTKLLTAFESSVSIGKRPTAESKGRIANKARRAGDVRRSNVGASAAK